MVFLTMTPAIVRALEKARDLGEDHLQNIQRPSDPSLVKPEAGKPISHGQLIDLTKLLKKHVDEIGTQQDETCRNLYRLDPLLKGSKVYVPPPPPKKEPTSEFKTLMDRLRREEEARAYERMLNPPLEPETFAQRFGASPLAHVDTTVSGVEEDDISYADVHRQVILIINILVSIVASSVFIWVAARHWSVPKRLGMSMSGSGVIAVAEVVIYSGYVRRAKEAKQKERKKPERKEIIESWVIDGVSGGQKTTPISTSKEVTDETIRYRKGKHR